jgi:hypothetical protein
MSDQLKDLIDIALSGGPDDAEHWGGYTDVVDRMTDGEYRSLREAIERTFKPIMDRLAAAEGIARDLAACPRPDCNDYGDCDLCGEHVCAESCPYHRALNFRGTFRGTADLEVS